MYVLGTLGVLGAEIPLDGRRLVSTFTAQSRSDEVD
jgi:hypothetical protein